MDGSFAAVITASGPGPLEDLVFATRDPVAIAVAFDEACGSALGSRIDGAFFYLASQGCVLGARLDDGREVAIKAH